MNKQYRAESIENGIKFGHTYSASSFDHAEQIAIDQGWTLLGEFIYEEECSDDMIAMIERDSRNITVH